MFLFLKTRLKFGLTWTDIHVQGKKRLNCPRACSDGTEGNGGTATLILNLGLKLNAQPHVLAALPPGKAPLLGTEPRFLGRSVRVLVTITKELYILTYTVVVCDFKFKRYCNGIKRAVNFKNKWSLHALE